MSSLAIEPVKVKAKESPKTVETYVFLDGGSNTTFCTENMLSELNADGRKTTLSLATMAQEDSSFESSIVSLKVFDLNENNFIELPTVFSSTRLPVSKESMATQRNVEKWPHLDGIELPEIDAEVILLIGSDAPEALQPWEVRRGHKGEPPSVGLSMVCFVEPALYQTQSTS